MMNHCVNPGDTIQIGIPHVDTPSDIDSFLSVRGWTRVGSSTWQHNGKSRWGMSWEQAVACEFYEFITIGGR